jgi:hypothetical protein
MDEQELISVAQQYDLPRKNNRINLQTPAQRPYVSNAVPVPPAQPSVPLATKGDPRGKIAVIRAAAEKYGVNPDVAVKVAKSEGLAQFYGDNGASGGAFQLFTKGGLGNEFQKETGLNPLDQKNEDATIDYAMRRASQDGWGAWYGAAKVGVGKYDGISGKATPLDPTPNVGGGEESYKTPLVDPTPNVGSGESDYKADTPDDDKKDKKKKTNWGEAAGEGLENVGKAYAAGAKSVKDASNSGLVPNPVLPIPQGPVPMFDAKRAELQRQQLAIAMQRLNSGRLG